MWEHWNSQKEDGSFWSTNMNSFNHYAYGAVFDWIFCVSSGITPRKPGYSEVDISPNPCKELGFADASIETRHGKIRVYWYYRDTKVHYEIEIPKNVKAYLRLDAGKERVLEGGKYLFTV
jgi:alpha-L-rhamnosidase